MASKVGVGGAGLALLGAGVLSKAPAKQAPPKPPPRVPGVPERDGFPVNPYTDDYIEAYFGASPGGEFAASTFQPLPEFHLNDRPSDQPTPTGWAPTSRKVGWSVRDSRGRLLRTFAFNINPQAIARSHTSRTQMFATRGGFYVDNFGQGPTQITVTQLVGSGNDYGNGQRATARYDVALGFYENIFKYVVERSYSDTPLVVRFHDYHWQSGWAEQVFFPAGGFTVQRAVELQNVWSVAITMVSLQSFKNKDADSGGAANATSSRLYLVKRGDTLHKIVYAALKVKKGHTLSAAQYNNYLNKVIALNKKYDDISKARNAPIYSSISAGSPSAHHNVKRLQLYPGERVLLPA